MYVKKGFKGVSTALATIAIISVLILGMSWMAYMAILNAQQQAAVAGRAETVALKAKELVRVYVWLDPARQPDGRYLNLTRISFVNEWSGETVINGLLVVYNNQPAEMRQANIRLGAGERKTYLPSELGLGGLDNYEAFLSRVKYVQAHTSLGNDFVSLWGYPDKPALYVTGTTRTDTYTITTTETTYVPTTTTRSRTITSYTVTVTTTTTEYGGNPYMWGSCTPGPAYSVSLSFSPGTWGTPPYRIIVTFTWTNYWGTVGATNTYTANTNGAWSGSFNELYGYPPDYHRLSVTFTVVDSAGNGAQIGVGCSYNEPPSGGTNNTTSLGPPTTLAPDAVYVTVTSTIWETYFTYPGGSPPYTQVTATTTLTDYRWVGSTVWYTSTSVIESVEFTTVRHGRPYWETVTEEYNRWQPARLAGGPAMCPAGDLPLVPLHSAAATPEEGSWRPVVEGAAVAGLLYGGRVLQGRRRGAAALTAAVLMAGALLLAAGPPPALAGYATQQTTITIVTWVYLTTWVTIYETFSSTYTGTTYVTVWTTTTITHVATLPITTVTETRVTTQTIYSSFYVTTVTTTSTACWCTPPRIPDCAYRC